MTSKWYVLTLFGADQHGIVAKTTKELFAVGANLGETSMTRLGDYFTIMAFIEFDGAIEILEKSLVTVSQSLNLQFHFDKLGDHRHSHSTPNIRITFYGRDALGLVANVTSELDACGINILDLQTDMTDSEGTPLYVINIEGESENENQSLKSAVKNLKEKDIDIHVDVIDTLIG